MKNRIFDNLYLSSFCLELGLVLDAGIPLSEGVAMLAEGERDHQATGILKGIYEELDLGGELHTALRNSGAFPPYMVDSLRIGEETGNLDSSLRALSAYYNQQERLAQTIRSAVLYPVVLLGMLLFVVIVLITQVLPIFNDVFNQLGSAMSGAALAIMRFGVWLGANWLPVLLAVAALLVAFALLWRSERGRAALTGFGPGRRLSGEIGAARFASAMAMTMQSGMDTDEALQMADALLTDAAMRQKLAVCREKLDEGAAFPDAIAAAGIFDSLHARMLSVGFRTGAADSVMAELARRCDEKAQQSIGTIVGRVEPTLVVIMTVLVGLILLSVMLPLMGVMSGLG